MHVRYGGAVTYDLMVFPVDRSMTFEEASAVIDAFVGGASVPGAAHDTRLDPFIAAMQRRYWRLRGIGPLPPPFEFDVLAGYILIGIPLSKAAEVTEAVGEAAYRSGLAVLDPQRTAIGLPAPYADSPMTAAGDEPQVASADDAGATLPRGAAMASGDAPPDLRRAIADRLAAAGLLTTRAPGPDVTPDTAGEDAADPMRLPSSLQTPERRAALIAALGATKSGERHRALGELARWDPDPAVAAALRPILASDDVFAAGEAATGLARQADITDLPGVLDLVYRLSPADGGNAETMLIPLRAALALAELGGPMAVDGVKDRARTWRGARKVRHQSWEQVFDRELDELLADS
jgi:hypothetical protein